MGSRSLQRHGTSYPDNRRIEGQVRCNPSNQGDDSLGSTTHQTELKITKATVLPAGRGERLWPLAEKNPKHLVPIGGDPLVARTIKGLVKAGVREIIVLVRFEAEKIRGYLQDGSQFGCEIEYVKQKQLGGNADAVRA